MALLRRATCQTLFKLQSYHHLQCYRSFSQSRKTTNKNEQEEQIKKHGRIRKTSQYYQQHKPKAQESSIGTETSQHAEQEQARGEKIDYSSLDSENYAGVVTTASANRPTPHFSNHQYSKIETIGSKSNETGFHFGAGAVPKETVGSSVSAAELSASAAVVGEEIGSPEHVRNMLLSLTHKNPTMLPTPTLFEQWELLKEGLKKCITNSSIFSKLFAICFASLLFFGDYLDKILLNYKDPNMVYSFISGSSDESIMNGLKTGDIVVFQSCLWSFNILNTFRVILRQFVCDGAFDHCGIILCNKHDSDFPYIVEIDQSQWLFGQLLYKLKHLMSFSSGKREQSSDEKESNNNDNMESTILETHPNLRRIKVTPFDERILTAREPSIVVRQVNRVVVEPKINEELSDWLDNLTAGEQHNHNVIFCFRFCLLCFFFVETSRNIWLFCFCFFVVQNIDKISDYMNELPSKRDSIRSLFLDLWFPGDNTINLRSQMKDLKRQIALNDFQIETQSTTNVGIAADRGTLGLMASSKKYRVKNTDQLRQEIINLKLELQLKKDNLQRRLKKVNLNRKICSSGTKLIWFVFCFILI